MIRRMMDFVMILIFVWACMLLGLWIIDSLIVPLNFPFPKLTSDIAKAVISVLLVLSWFWLWKKIAEKIFGNALRRD